MITEKISMLCAEENISIAQLEKKLGLGNGTIGKWNNANPSLRKASMVAKYFGISIDELISDDPISPRECREIAAKIQRYSKEQKDLIKCYMSLIESGKVG